MSAAAASGSSLGAALEYASAGLLVFPTFGVTAEGGCECGNAACSSPGKHPVGMFVPRGVLDATDLEEKLSRWFTLLPSSNVAIATGRDVFVVDCDGEAARAAFLALGEVPTTSTARTPRGWHYWFGKDEGVHVRNQQGLRGPAGDPVPGVDVRGESGYVVAPPSRGVAGSYAWERGLEQLAAAPPWLLQLVAGPTHDPSPHFGGQKQTQAPRELDAARLAEIRRALELVPANCGRQDWVERVSMPLHDFFGGSEEGFALWHEWCARGRGLVTPTGNPAYGGEPECRRVWRSFSARHRNPKGISTFFQYAAQFGPTSAQTPPLPTTNGHHVPPLFGSPPPTWGDPEPLKQDEHEGLALSERLDPARAFPEKLAWLRDFAGEIARLLQVPFEFPALLCAAAASGTYGRVYQIQLADTPWIEFAPIWVICAFQSGAGKSPVFRPIAAPFREWEDSARQEAAELVADWEASMDVAKTLLNKAQTDAKRQAKRAQENPPVRTELERVLKEARRRILALEHTRPQSTGVLASSLTTPALVEFLMRHQERALILDPEGSIFQHVLGGKNDTDKDVDPWLKAFSCEPIQQDRVGGPGRSGVRFVGAPCLSMALCTQISQLSLFRDDFADGKGFLARFIPVMFPRILPNRALVRGKLSEELADRWRLAVHRNLVRKIPSKPTTIELAGAGAAAFEAWCDEWLDRSRKDLQGGDVLSYESPAAAKLRSYALRLVLLLHVLSTDDPAAEPVDGAVVAAVLESWMPFVMDSVGRVMGNVRDDPDQQIARRLLGWVSRKRPTEFSRTEAWRNLKSRGTSVTTVTRVNDLNGALGVLADAGWIQPVDKPRPRGPGTVAAASRYAVHPRFPEHFAALSGSL